MLTKRSLSMREHVARNRRERRREIGFRDIQPARWIFQVLCNSAPSTRNFFPSLTYIKRQTTSIKRWRSGGRVLLFMKEKFASANALLRLCTISHHGYLPVNLSLGDQCELELARTIQRKYCGVQSMSGKGRRWLVSWISGSADWLPQSSDVYGTGCADVLWLAAKPEMIAETLIRALCSDAVAGRKLCPRLEDCSTWEWHAHRPFICKVRNFNTGTRVWPSMCMKWGAEKAYS